MAPAGQYVFAEMLGISEHFTAGSHEWLPYSVIPTFPKLICKQQFVSLSIFKEIQVNLQKTRYISYRVYPSKSNYRKIYFSTNSSARTYISGVTFLAFPVTTFSTT